MGKCSPNEHFSVACLGFTMAWGIAATWGGSSVLILWAGVGTGTGGIGQSFLVSNRFSEAHPALGQGILCLTGAMGMSSTCCGGLDPLFWGLVVRHGTSANCPVANLYTVTGMDVAVDLVTGICMEVVATAWVGAAEFTGAVWVVVHRYRLGKDSHLVPSFSYHSPLPLVRDICLWSWGFSKHRVGVCLGSSWLGLLWLVCCSWVWGGGLGFGPGFPSNSKYVFIFQMREG